MMANNGAALATHNDKVEQVRALLRTIQFPGFQRDIVAAGFVRSIGVEGERVTIDFAPNTRSQAKVEQMENDIRVALSGADYVEQVEIQLHRPFADADVLSGGGQSSPQSSVAGTSGTPEHDIIDTTMQRPDMAPQAGYSEDGPAPMAGPRSDSYEGKLPVFQWEIDPHNPDAKSDTANLTIDDWEFRVWWQLHPAQLVYASIQAMQGDRVEHDGAARSHPVGRTEAVNLVYDAERKAVVAIYGTVQDFRPFVAAFHRGYILKD